MDLLNATRDQRAEEKRLIEEQEAVLGARHEKCERYAAERAAAAYSEPADYFQDLVMNTHGLYLLCGLFFGGGIAYTMFFGLHVMGWSILDSVFFFAITVSTTGYNDMGAHSDRMHKWLLAYMWVCVLVCGLGLGVVIAFAHENFESGMANITASTYEEEEAEKASTGGEKEAHASRIVAHARAKMRNLNGRTRPRGRPGTRARS